MSAALAHHCWGVIVGPSLLRVLFVMATQRTGDSSEATNVPAKRRKLVTCRTVSFSALECFCQLAKERPEVLEFNRQGQYRASQDLYSCMGASSLLGPHEWRHIGGLCGERGECRPMATLIRLLCRLVCCRICPQNHDGVFRLC